MDGVLLVDKPENWTSFDAVAKVRGIVRRETGKKKPKVGHTGTLDPLATGLLVLLLGSYTKRAQELTKLDKTYEVTVKLGETSTTGDEEGKKSTVSSAVPAQAAVNNALSAFVGEISQVPPAYSAVKVNGQRAYKLARAGKEVNIEPRTVHIYDIRDVTYDYPFVTFTADVSSGTYVRSLVEDIGKKLETGAYMSALRRIKIGQFDVADATPVEGIDEAAIQSHLQTLA